MNKGLVVPPMTEAFTMISVTWQDHDKGQLVTCQDSVGKSHACASEREQRCIEEAARSAEAHDHLQVRRAASG